MPSKYASLFVVALLMIFFSLNQQQAIGRPEPADPSNTNGQKEVADQEEVRYEKMEEVCGGEKEEECLMRRTLEAQIDYIYTQGKHN
ncbi:Phytosulfokines 3 [Ananas comosus]|uniref:Phytosulfokine n=1 Tax=Ananas comosus TaxID=4615 RepID=A0A199VL23_ANACO|nr:Phytosulfokines 3 [Ananas comosus]